MSPKPSVIPLNGHGVLAPYRARLGLVGSMMARHAGHVTTQEYVLSNLLKDAGYPVVSVSACRNRYARLGDIVCTLIRQCREMDLVILSVYSGPSFVVEDIASAIASFYRRPIIMVLHGGGMPQFMARWPRWTKRVLGRANVLVTPTRYLARAVAAHGFQAHCIPNTIQLPAYRYQHRSSVKPRLFWMRSFHSIYNPRMAIRVLARLRKTEPEATLVMAGQEKGMQAEVRQLAADLGIEAAVTFPGFLDDQGKARKARECDIFINTNHVDNTPVAVLEACAMGMPVVATAVGGLPDLLTDEETGLLTPDDDDEAMTNCILRLLREPRLAGRLSDNGRRLAESCSWDQVRPQWESLFDQVLRRS